MTILLQTRDQVPGRGTSEGPRLSFESRETTAREIVRARVRLEVENYNCGDRIRPVAGLLTSPAIEQELNGLPRPRPPLDAERQIDLALEAVRKGRVILMFNGVQVRDLDEPLAMTPVSEARFLKLVPLVGG